MGIDGGRGPPSDEHEAEKGGRGPLEHDMREKRSRRPADE